MTSQSDLEKKVLAALDERNATLSPKVTDDIAQARMNAIRAAGAQTQKRTLQKWVNIAIDRFRQEVLVNNFKFAAPVVVAVFVAVLVSYHQDDTVPMLPQELLFGEVPGEELALLQELEFASWLAQQQQEGHL